MKGLAVDTVIKLMLVLLVLLFIGYWLIRSPKVLSAEQCRSLFIDWCKNCFFKGWTGALPWSEDLLSCADKYANATGMKTPITYAGGCNLPEARNECAKFGIT
jgi:hypothetical protein